MYETKINTVNVIIITNNIISNIISFTHNTIGIKDAQKLYLEKIKQRIDKKMSKKDKEKYLQDGYVQKDNIIISIEYSD